MIKALMEGAGLAPIAVMGLLVFVAVFVGVSAWALTRSRQTVANWSALPLADGQQRPTGALPLATPNQEFRSCGKRENGDC